MAKRIYPLIIENKETPEEINKSEWLDYPTETGWWLSKKEKEIPEVCKVIKKKDVVIALFPEKGYKRYLDVVSANITYQKI